MESIFTPFRLKLLRRTYAGKPINFLDVGCGSHSPTITKSRFPHWHYYGMLPLLVPAKYVLRRRLSGGDFWDISGFASYVYAEKR